MCVTLICSFPFRGSSYLSKSYRRSHRPDHIREDRHEHSQSIGSEIGNASTVLHTCVSCKEIINKQENSIDLIMSILIFLHIEHIQCLIYF